MSELDYWMRFLLDKGISANGIKEFESMYRDVIYSTSINDDIDRIKMLDVISRLGNDDEESEILRQYLFYAYGKFVTADIYAGCIGLLVANASADDKILIDHLNELMDKALNKIIEI